eukprot:s934_g11.t1
MRSTRKENNKAMKAKGGRKLKRSRSGLDKLKKAKKAKTAEADWAYEGELHEHWEEDGEDWEGDGAEGPSGEGGCNEPHAPEEVPKRGRKAKRHVPSGEDGGQGKKGPRRHRTKAPETDPEDNQGENSSTKPKGKAKAKATAKATAKAKATPKGKAKAKAKAKGAPKAAPKAKAKGKAAKKQAKEDEEAVEKILEWSRQVDVLADDYKETVKELLPSYSTPLRLNVYWTKSSCGLSLRYVDDNDKRQSRDVGHFFYEKGVYGLVIAGWELEQKEIVHPDTEDHDMDAIKQRWKDIGAQAMERIAAPDF